MDFQKVYLRPIFFFFFKRSNFQISLGYLSVLDMVKVNKSVLSDFFAICQPNILLNGLQVWNLKRNFRLESGIQKICKMESHYSKFYIVFKQAVLYLDLWRFGRIRVWWNWWRMGRRGGRKRNNSWKNDLKPISHSGRVLERSFPTNFWDRNCWKVVWLYFQGQEKNLLL